jgi:YggT family protein
VFRSGHILYDLGWLYLIVLFLRAIMSWFPASPDSPLNPVRRVLFVLTEPVLAPFRRVIPPVGMLDISFLVAYLVILFIVNVILIRIPL